MNLRTALSLTTTAVVATLAAMVLLSTYGAAVSQLEDARPAASQPYGGCKEAWQAPQSDGADWCRDHGWTVRGNLVVGPRGVVRYDAMPECRHEDGSGQRAACSWNFWGHYQGNGRGLSYWVDRADRARYVWATVDQPREIGPWVTRDQARTLREGYGAPGGFVRWTQCVNRIGDTSVTICPNGRRVTS